MSTTILMVVTKSAAKAIEADGVDISIQHLSQIVTAGLLAYGVSKLEEAIRHKVPFVLDPANRDDGTDLMPWPHQLHDTPMIERTMGILRSKDVLVDDTDPSYQADLEKAKRIVWHVKDHIIKHGLHVYSQKWIFDSSRPLNDRLGLLHAMANPSSGPQSASTAIASGLMPPLPAYSVPNFVRMLDPSWIGSTFQVTNRNLRDWIALRKPYLVEFPLPNVAAGKSARTDRISRWDGGQKIELGLGFMLVEVDQDYDQFRVVTPMLFAGRTTQEPAAKYSKGYILKSYTRVYAKEYKQLADLLRNPGRTKIARLQVCADCGMIYSDEHSDLAHASCAS